MDEIATFVEVAEQGSLAAAARELGVPRSTVSRRIARLEDELGHELIQRHSRLFRLTEAGDMLYKRAAPAVRDIQEATRFLRHGGEGLSGDLHLTMPQDLGAATPVVRALTDFQQAHPKIRLWIDLTDRVIDLAAEGYDFALRMHNGLLEDTTSLKVRNLGHLAVGLFASPDYLDRMGRPQSPQDLDEHLLVAPYGANLPESRVLEHKASGKRVPLEMSSRLRASAMNFFPPAAASGAGIVAITYLAAASYLERGALERVLPDWSLTAANLSLLWPASRLASPRRRAFLDFLPEHLTL